MNIVEHLWIIFKYSLKTPTKRMTLIINLFLLQNTPQKNLHLRVSWLLSELRTLFLLKFHTDVSYKSGYTKRVKVRQKRIEKDTERVYSLLEKKSHISHQIEKRRRRYPSPLFRSQSILLVEEDKRSDYLQSHKS